MPSLLLSCPRDGVVVVTLNRPDRLNALDETLVADLSESLTKIATDPDCQVVILTGAGRGFCSGLDLQQYSEDPHPRSRPSVIDMLQKQRSIAALAEQLHRLPQPVIAAVNGPAAGGGLALVSASDIRIAADTAVFAVSFIRAGYSGCDIGVSWLLPRIVGAGHAHDLMLTGRRADAGEAARIGLVTAVVSPETLLDVALAKADEIMLNPPFSVELTKQGMWIALETPAFLSSVEFENRQQMLTAVTRDQAEATGAFLEKRPPAYERR